MANRSFSRAAATALAILGAGLLALPGTGAVAQSTDGASAGGNGEVYYPPRTKARANDAYAPPDDGTQSKIGTLNNGGKADGYGAGSAYNSGGSANNSGRAAPSANGDYNTGGDGRGTVYRPPAQADADGPGYGAPYREPSTNDRGYGRRYDGPPGPGPGPGYGEGGGTYSQNEIFDAGHHFFGGVSKGLAEIVEHAFRTQGRPNGYILGEDAGGAFIAGLRYGEGRLYTRDAGTHSVFWQGPSVGYDFGGEGSKAMVLVYNLRDPDDIYHRFGGIEGSAYFVGGVSIVFQKYGDIILAPIRAGVGLRIGANVGYLKYTRSPTWNPF